MQIGSWDKINEIIFLDINLRKSWFFCSKAWFSESHPDRTRRAGSSRCWFCSHLQTDAFSGSTFVSSFCAQLRKAEPSNIYSSQTVKTFQRLKMSTCVCVLSAPEGNTEKAAERKPCSQQYREVYAVCVWRKKAATIKLKPSFGFWQTTGGRIGSWTLWWFSPSWGQFLQQEQVQETCSYETQS